MRARRRILAALLAVSAAMPALAQSAGKTRTVGILVARSRVAPPETDVFEEILQGLAERGYVEGKNLRIEWRYASGKYDALPGLAKELVGLGVDLIVAADGTPVVQAAQKVTRTVPIVFINVGDPVGSGLVASLSKPGGNTTGVSLLLHDTTGKQVEMVKATVPRLTRLGALWNSANSGNQIVLERLRATAKLAGLSLVEVGARTEAEIDQAFTRMASEGVGAFVWVPESFLIQQRRRIADLAARHRIPGMGGFREYPEAGGLMSYGVNRRENYRRAAAYVDKIFRGWSPGDLPVEQPTKLELVLNQKVAKSLGVKFPPELLLLADRVIE